MTENASHVVVHHHFDNASGAKLISMTCCIVLGVVIVLILFISLAIIIYMLLQRTKRNPQDTNPANISDTLPATRNRTASNTLKSESSNIRRGIVNPAASFEDNETDIHSNRQSIPMTTFRVDNDSSESSTGLCEVLFPPQHEGEVICEPPPKVVAFAGRVYATSRRNSRPILPSESQPSGSGTGHQSVNRTLEWDYHESRRYGASNDPEEDRRDTINICWV